MKCPCEECISFAICYNRDRTECYDLYLFVCKTRPNRYGVHMYGGHKKKERLIVKKLFNRKVESTKLETKEVSFLPDPMWGRD